MTNNWTWKISSVFLVAANFMGIFQVTGFHGEFISGIDSDTTTSTSKLLAFSWDFFSNPFSRKTTFYLN